MSVLSAQGTTSPFASGGVPYPSFGNLVPALHSFRLTYPFLQDHEITAVQILAGGDSQDLSPNADLNPVSIPDGRLEALFQDASPTGEQFAYSVSHSALSIPGARRFQIRDTSCVDFCVRELPNDLLFGGPPNQPTKLADQPLLALVGFKLFFMGGRDREIHSIGVGFRNDRQKLPDDDGNVQPNQLSVSLNDRTGGEPFGYLVDFIAIPRSGLDIETSMEFGKANTLRTVPFASDPFTSGALKTPNNGHSLLTNWGFGFQDNIDRRLLDLGVVRRDDDFTVIFSDESGGEDFSWRIDWANVSPKPNRKPDAFQPADQAVGSRTSGSVS